MAIINKVRIKPKPKVDKPVNILKQFETAFDTVKVADASLNIEGGNTLYTRALSELDEALQKNGGKDNKKMYVHFLVAKLKVYRNWVSHLEWIVTNSSKKRSLHETLVSEKIQPLVDEISVIAQGKRGLYSVVKILCNQIYDTRFPTQPFKQSKDEVIAP